jgi:STE24 endopeptidase
MRGAENWFLGAVVVAIVLKAGTEIFLEVLNSRYARAHAGMLPAAFSGVMDDATYQKSTRYTLAKSRITRIETVVDTLILLIVLFSGILPALFDRVLPLTRSSAWSGAIFLFLTGALMALPGLPLSWYSQFRIEDRFGFNTSTQARWWMDRLKGLMLSLVLGLPLLWLLLKLVDWTGQWWWLWAWGALLGFQLLMTVLAPVLILPLFNKLTPLPEGALRQRLLNLAASARFHAGNILVMDGSKRSRHSNAFFTGFGAFRKIVLFDTLLAQLGEPEVEAVLAHEIGHFKKKHIPKMLVATALSSLIGFFLISVLTRQEWFYHPFGFMPGAIAPALLLFGLLSGPVMFWVSPLTHWWSRRYEYEADAYAAHLTREPQSLIGALRKLNEKNLSNLTPHPAYSAFYYSHPTLLERENALAAVKSG